MRKHDNENTQKVPPARQKTVAMRREEETRDQNLSRKALPTLIFCHLPWTMTVFLLFSAIFRGRWQFFGYFLPSAVDDGSFLFIFCHPPWTMAVFYSFSAIRRGQWQFFIHFLPSAVDDGSFLVIFCHRNIPMIIFDLFFVIRTSR